MCHTHIFLASTCPCTIDEYWSYYAAQRDNTAYGEHEIDMPCHTNHEDTAPDDRFEAHWHGLKQLTPGKEKPKRDGDDETSSTTSEAPDVDPTHGMADSIGNLSVEEMNLLVLASITRPWSLDDTKRWIRRYEPNIVGQVNKEAETENRLRRRALAINRSLENKLGKLTRAEADIKRLKACEGHYSCDDADKAIIEAQNVIDALDPFRVDIETEIARHQQLRLEKRGLYAPLNGRWMDKEY